MRMILIDKAWLLFFAGALCLVISVAAIVQVRNADTVYVAAEPYYQGVGQEQVVSLAINVDWGEAYLPDMLRVLDDHSVKATFFLTGRWTDEHRELAKSIVTAGQEIGNHAYSHKSPNQLSYEGNLAEIKKTSDSIVAATGVRETLLYAPPSGEREEHVLKAAADLGYATVLWSVDTVDWKRPPSDVIIKRVMKKAHPGAIILAHPTSPTLEALPSIIEGLQGQGYVFVTVSQNIMLNKQESGAD